MWPSWMNMLAWWQWAVLLAVPPAIVSLYFLKLRRRPVEVPSTYLWSRTIEDMHVNSIWQRLRRNLLLLLQLLLMAMLILALLRPAWRGEQLIGRRFVFLIDNSASMRATDVEPNRLEQAKRRALALIDNMRSGDVGMVISFADTARIEQMFTDHRGALRRAVESIEPTDRPTSLVEALKVASARTHSRSPGDAAGSDEDAELVATQEGQPATAYILSDGRFARVSESSLGNLSPVYVPIGEKNPANVAVLSFCAQRHEKFEERLQAFARVKNFGEKRVEVDAVIELDGRLRGATRLSIGPGEAEPVVLDVGEVESGVIALKVRARDSLAADDEAWVAVNAPRRAKVLLITPGNEPLETALATQSAKKLAAVAVEPPSFLKTDRYAAAAAGVVDLIIFDRCRPEVMPQANTLFFGFVPSVEGWSLGEAVPAPRIIDIDATHPIMQWLAMDDVLLAEGRPISLPAGGNVLVDSDAGPMLAVAPRETFQDMATGFALVDDTEGAPSIRTNWPIRPSFPMFVLNVLSYLGNAQQQPGQESVRPGQAVMLDAPPTGVAVSVVHPDGKVTRLDEIRTGKYRFTGTDKLGVYEVRLGGDILSRFAVNLLDPNESDLAPREALEAGMEKIAGQAGWEAARREIWRTLLVLGLFVLVIEWYIYGRRVSM
ncbi:MAG: VWA domain-containing protein [Pirellulaceae bacterium]|nr:VWA domain-containing protein [Pirellulaceae bacterium]